MDASKTGQLIAELRKNSGMNQTDLAEKLNISNRTVSKWENGDGFPDISLIPDIASIFGITTDELFAGELFVKEEDNQIAYPQFVFTGKDSLKSYIAIQKRFYRQRVPVWFQIIITICVLLILIFLTGLVKSVTGENLVSMGFIMVILFILLIISFFQPYLAGFMTYINAKAFNGNKNVEDTLVISDKLYMDNGSKHWEYNFSDITGFYEYKNYYIFRIHKRVFAATEKSDLQTGNNAEFESYINSVVTTKSEPKWRLVLLIVLAVILSCETIFFGALFIFTVDVDTFTQSTYSVEEILEMDDSALCENMYFKIDEKTYYNEEDEQLVLTDLNQTELNIYYVYSLYTGMSQDGSIISYISEYNTDLAYLSGALIAVGLDDVADEYNKFINDNKIDVAAISKVAYIDYDEALEKYDDKSFSDFASKTNLKERLIKSLAQYIKSHSSDFEDLM